MELFSRTPQRHGKRESSESGLKKTGLKVGCGGTPEDTPRASVMVLIRADNCFSRKRLVLRWGLLPTQDINPEQFCKKKKKKSFIFFKKKNIRLGKLSALSACLFRRQTMPVRRYPCFARLHRQRVPRKKQENVQEQIKKSDS